MDDTRFDAAASHRHAPRASPVIAAAEVVDLRRAAHFAHSDHERVFQQSTFLEIVEQRDERAVEFRAADLMPVKIVLMGIPIEMHDPHATDARFDQPPGQQAVLAEFVAAITFMGRRRLLFQREQFRAAHQGAGPLERGLMAEDRSGVATAAKARVGGLPSPLGGRHGRGRNACRRSQIGGRPIVHDLDRLVPRPEEPGIAHIGVRLRRVPPNADVSGKNVIRPFQQLGHGGTDDRVAGRDPPRLQRVVSLKMVADPRVHAAQHREAMEIAGTVGKQFSDVRAGQRGGDRSIGATRLHARFGIPSL